jgi:hypothetical protein
MNTNGGNIAGGGTPGGQWEDPYNGDPLQYPNQVNVPYYTPTSSTKFGICRTCGETKILFPLLGLPIEICEGCAKGLSGKIYELMIPKGSKVHCMTCHSHIKACVCKSTQDLKDMVE